MLFVLITKYNLSSFIAIKFNSKAFIKNILFPDDQNLPNTALNVFLALQFKAKICMRWLVIKLSAFCF